MDEYDALNPAVRNLAERLESEVGLLNPNAIAACLTSQRFTPQHEKFLRAFLDMANVFRVMVEDGLFSVDEVEIEKVLDRSMDAIAGFVYEEV